MLRLFIICGLTEEALIRFLTSVESLVIVNGFMFPLVSIAVILLLRIIVFLII